MRSLREPPSFRCRVLAYAFLSASLSSIALLFGRAEWIAYPYWLAWLASLIVVAAIACRMPGVACDELGNETTMTIAQWVAPLLMFFSFVVVDFVVRHALWFLRARRAR